MPAAIPLLAGAFLAAGTVATAVGVGLGVAMTIGSVAITWAAVATITGVALMGVAMLTMRTPKPGSSGGQLDSKLDVRAPVPIAYGRTATGGYIGYQQSFGAKNAFLAMVAILSAGPVQAIETHRANDSNVYYSGNPTTSLATSTGVGDGSKLFKNKLRTRYQLGEAPASQSITQATGLALPGNPGKLSGLACAISVLEYNQDAFPQGVPKNLWVLRGVKLYDPRKDSTYPGGSGAHRRDNPATWEYSENPYLAALDWTLGRWWNGKKVYGIGARLEEVEVAAFVAGANVADANGWKIGGVVTTDDNKFAVLSTILQTGGGVPVARGAQISCLVNAPKTSSFTLKSSDIIGEIEVMNSTSWRDRSNTVVPTYREESQLWALVAGEQVTSASYIAEDAGEKKIVEVQYPLVQQAAQAHQLATYDLANSREFLTFTVNCRVRALNVRAGDAITVNIPEIAASNQKCIVIGREFNPADLSVTLTLKSETDAKHPFALGQSQVAPAAPALDGYNPSAPGAPAATAWSITGTKITKDGTSIPAIVINGETDDPNASSVIVEYRPVGDPVWKDWGAFSRNTRQIELTAVTAQTAYEVALSYRTVRGVVSDRLVMTATAGDMKVDWGTVVSGTGKPQDNATVGAPTGTYVGDVEASALVIAQFTAAATQLKAIATTETNRIRDRALYFPAPDGASLYTLNVRETTERKAADDVFTETFELLGAVSPDGSAFNLNDNFVMVEDGVSLSQRLAILDTKTGANSASIEEVARTITDVNTAIAQNYTTLDTKIGSNQSSIDALAETVTNANTAQATTNQNLTAAVGGNSTSIDHLAQVLTTTTTAQATTNETLTAAVGEHSTSITDIKTVLTTESGSVAKALLRVNADGHVLGYSLTNDGTTGNFEIDADAFRITDPNTGNAYFYADDSGKVVMRNVEVDTIKVGSVDKDALSLSSAQKVSFCATSSLTQCPYNVTTPILSYTFAKEDDESILELMMFARASSDDDLIFDADLLIDGALIQRATTKMILVNASASSPTYAFTLVPGVPAGEHTVALSMINREGDAGPLRIDAGATLKVTEFRKGSIANSSGSAAPVTTGGDSGGGGSGGGDDGGSGGGGGPYGGGGYCVTVDTPILLADGSEKRAGELMVGDSLTTRHERTMEWGEYPVSRVEFVSAGVWTATIDGKTLRATPEHRVWHDGAWIAMEQLGKPDGRDVVAKITTLYAHTYISNGILSHNIKQFETVDQ
jgi:uncharacterized membrane protein YgcG